MTVQSPATATRITAPANGTMLALDPDIPPANQRLQLRSDATPAASRSLQWFVGEVPLARGATAQWMPMPGRFTLALKDGQGRQLDAVRIEVRGAGLAEPVAKRRP
jgi:penicillin-binding protein 1C